MEKNVSLKELIKNVVIVLLAFVAYKVIKTLFLGNISDGVVNVFVSEVIILSCAIIAAICAKKVGVLKLSSKGILTGLWVGMFVFLTDGLRLVYWFVQYNNNGQSITESGIKIVLFLLSMVMVGISEEVLFRGVLLNACSDYFGESSVASIRKAIIISSCVFGLAHISNVSSGASLVGALFQSFNAIALGMIFAVVYVRSGKNLWPCVILHGFHDLCSFILSGLLSGVTSSGVVSSYDASTIPSIVTLFIVAFIIMRKKKIEPYLL